MRTAAEGGRPVPLTKARSDWGLLLGEGLSLYSFAASTHLW